MYVFVSVTMEIRVVGPLSREEERRRNPVRWNVSVDMIGEVTRGQRSKGLTRSLVSWVGNKEHRGVSRILLRGRGIEP